MRCLEVLHCYSYLLKHSVFVCIYAVILSYNKSATQSTTYQPDSSAFVAGNAVDGSMRTCMRTKVIGTTSPDKTVWWKVDLGAVYNIYSVDIMLYHNYRVEYEDDGIFGIVLHICNHDKKISTTYGFFMV